MKKAIYLAGGGARGAYQAGALKAIADIIKAKSIPVEIISSVSSGAINAAYLAMYAEDFSLATTRLIDLWSSLSSDKIFKTSNLSLMNSVIRNTLSLIFHSKAVGGGYLLNTAPLMKLLNKHLSFEKIADNVKHGLFTHFEIATTCYDSSLTVSFFESQYPEENWQILGHIAHSTKIHCHHILASAAIPLFFPAVKIDGLHYGDGAIGLTAPLQPAIWFQADKILVIGTSEVSTANSIYCEPTGDVTYGKVIGSVMHKLFTGNLEQNILTVKKINQAISYISPENQTKSKWRKIDIVYLYPSKSLGNLALNKENVLPYFLRYFITAFSEKNKSSEYLSFLLFEAAYCKELITMGYEDTLKRSDELKEFFS